MFGWFRKYVRKIGIFGVEVEFHPPTDSLKDKPTAVPASEPTPLASSGATVVAEPPKPITTPKPVAQRTRTVDEVMAADGLPEKQTGRYILLLGAPHVTGAPAPRYVHFSYKREQGAIAFCIRDFIGRAEWRQGERPFTAVDYWLAAQDIVICSRDEGLFKPIDQVAFWRQELLSRSES